MYHPGAQNRLLAQTIDLRQAPNAFLDVALEHLAAVHGGQPSRLDHLSHTVAL